MPSAQGSGLLTSPRPRARPTCPRVSIPGGRGGGLLPALAQALAGWPRAEPLPSGRLQLSPGVSTQLTGGPRYHAGQVQGGPCQAGTLFLGLPSWATARPLQGPCH